MFSKSLSAVVIFLLFVASHSYVDRCFAEDEPPPSYRPITKEDSKLKPGVKEPQPVAPYKGMLAADESTWDLDEIETNESASEKHVFKITNKSKETIKIKNIKAKWEHISISYPPLEVKAGDTADIDVKYTLRKDWGPIDHRIEIFTDESGEKSPLVLTIKGNRAATSELRAIPHELHFGTVSNHERATRKCVLKRDNYLPVKLLKIVANKKEITTRILSDDHDKVVFEVQLDSHPLPSGDFYGNLAVETDHPEYRTVNVRLSALIRMPRDYIVPSVLLKDLDGEKTVILPLISTGAGALKEPVAIERLEYTGDESIQAELTTDLENRPAVKFSRVKSAAISPHRSGELKLTLKDESNPIVIPMISVHRLSAESFSKLAEKEQLAYLRAAVLHYREVMKNVSFTATTTVKNHDYDKVQNRLTDKITVGPYTDTKTFRMRNDLYYQAEGERDYESLKGKVVSRISTIYTNLPATGRGYHYQVSRDPQGKLLSQSGTIRPAETHYHYFDPFVGYFITIEAEEMLNSFNVYQWLLNNYNSARIEKVDLDTGKVTVTSTIKVESPATVGSISAVFDLNKGEMIEEFHLERTVTFPGRKGDTHFAEIRLSDPIELAGVWIPRKFYGVTRADKYKFASVHESTLKDLEIGKLKLADFEIPFPVNTRVLNYVDDESYFVREGGKREPIDVKKERKEELARKKVEREAEAAKNSSGEIK